MLCFSFMWRPQLLMWIKIRCWGTLSTSRQTVPKVLLHLLTTPNSDVISTSLQQGLQPVEVIVSGDRHCEHLSFVLVHFDFASACECKQPKTGQWDQTAERHEARRSRRICCLMCGKWHRWFHRVPVEPCWMRGGQNNRTEVEESAEKSWD